MAFTLRSLSADKVVKKVDGFRAHISSIKVIEGFNVRTEDDDLREHVAGIAGAISAGLPIPPIEVFVNPETGDMELVEGHCRLDAYKLYAESNPDFDGWVSVTKFDGTPAQRKARTVSSNSQLKLKPIELGRAYLSLRDEHGMSRIEIAKEVGRSVAHIDQMLLLAGAQASVTAAVESGKISATEAVKLVRDHGQNAPAELERRAEVAKEAGKSKVTAKVSQPKKAPSRPRVDFVVSCAVVLSTHCERNAELMTSIESIAANPAGRGQCVSVDAGLIMDLISAVREMQQSGKALDADNQHELAM